MAVRLKGADVMACVTVKRVVVIKGPLPGVVTVMGPVVAPAGTVVVIVPGGLSVNVAATPLNETAVAPVKFAPLIVTPVPTGPNVGANGLKLIPSRKATMSSAAVGPIAVEQVSAGTPRFTLASLLQLQTEHGQMLRVVGTPFPTSRSNKRGT